MSPTEPAAPPPTSTVTVTSAKFKNGEAIPPEYAGVTPGGKIVSPPSLSVSPPLAWEWDGPPPPEAKCFVLLVYDPDAPVGVFVHWVVFNLPVDRLTWPDKRFGLREGVTIDDLERLGAKQGTNDFGNIGYGGPRPLGNQTHHYYFKVVAVKDLLNLPPGATMDQVKTAIKGRVAGWGQVVGTYGP